MNPQEHQTATKSWATTVPVSSFRALETRTRRMKMTMSKVHTVEAGGTVLELLPFHHFPLSLPHWPSWEVNAASIPYLM